MKILSLNGGGVLGYIPLVILSYIEEELGTPSHEIFDLIGGASTGAIIGGALAKGMTAKEVKTLYKKLSKEIFKNKRSLFMSLFRPLYDIDNLTNQLKDVFGDIKMNELKTEFMTYALRIDSKYLDSFFWKSWKDDIEVYKAVCASSSAPHYFSPYQIDEKWFVDAVLVGNNPAISLISEAMKKDVTPDDIKLLSLWSDTMKGIDTPNKFYGLITLLPKLSDLFSIGGGDSVDYYANNLLGDNFISIRPDANLPIDTDEFELMDKIANQIWDEHRKEILDLLS